VAVAESARYLYAITRSVDTEALRGVAGLRGAPLEQVEHRGLSAVVSDVPLAEFDEVALKRNLERLDWLEEVARGHDAVVQAATMAGPTAPMRLAVICHDDSGVRDRLEDWHDDLVEVLDRIEGRAEWSVKVVAPPPAEVAEESSAPTSGADYLRRKKASSEARQHSRDQLEQLADRMHHELAGRTVASRVLQPQDPQLSGHQGTMILNAAYLVDIDEGEGFASAARTLGQQHSEVTVEVGGPWPPYSFAVLEQR
jgi:hypothetical protein